MERPYTICHILSGLDGRIAGDFMTTAAARPAIGAYGRIRSSYQAQAWLYGTTTGKEFAGFRKPVYEDLPKAVPDGDFVARTDSPLYIVAVDVLGEIGWESATYQRQGGPDGHIIEILTEQTPQAHRAYLRERGISYILVGRDTLDCAVALQKLRQLFGIEKVLLCGGGEINWTFVSQGTVDELSLVLAPAADGDPQTPTVFERSPLLQPTPPAAFRLKTAERLEDDGLWLVYTVDHP